MDHRTIRWTEAADPAEPSRMLTGGRSVSLDVELSRWCEVNPSVKLRTGIGDIGMSY
jgi:hypothetical protein